MSEKATLTEDDVEEDAETVLDAFISVLGYLSPLGSIVAIALNWAGISFTGSTALGQLFTTLVQLFTKWESKLVSLAGEGFTVFEDVYDFFSDLVSTLKSVFATSDTDNDTDSDSEELATVARHLVGVPLFRSEAKAKAAGKVSKAIAFTEECAAYVAANPDASDADLKAGIAAIGATYTKD